MNEWEKRFAERQGKALEAFDEVCPPIYEDCSLDSAPRPDQFALVVDYWKRQKRTPDTRDHMLLFGGSGSGKTATAWCVGRAFVTERPGSDFMFVKSVHLIRLAKQRHLSSGAMESFNELFEPALEATLLVLDDIGTEKLSESAEEALFELIDTRCDNRRRTIITTNATSAQDLQRNFPRNGAKIMRRLKQFYLAVNFDAHPVAQEATA